MVDSTNSKSRKNILLFFVIVQHRALFYFPPYIFLFRLTNLLVACIFFVFPCAFDFFSMLQLFTLTPNGLVMCMRGRANTWWQAGIKPLVNSRWMSTHFGPFGQSVCVRRVFAYHWQIIWLSQVRSQNILIAVRNNLRDLEAWALALVRVSSSLYFNGMRAWWQETCPIQAEVQLRRVNRSKQTIQCGAGSRYDRAKRSDQELARHGLHSNKAAHGAGTGKLTLILRWARNLTDWTQGQERKAGMV